MISRSPYVQVSTTLSPLGREGTIVRMGYELAPVSLDTRGRNRVLIGLGSYLVNAQSVCRDREISDREVRAVCEYLSAIRALPDTPGSAA
jgi:hypothetical protein